VPKRLVVLWVVLVAVVMIFEQLVIIRMLKNFRTLLEAEGSTNHRISTPYLSSSQFVPPNVTAFHENQTCFRPSRPIHLDTKDLNIQIKVDT